MNHHRQKVLQSIFVHPISANIELKDVEHLFSDLGAQVEDKGERFVVALNGHTESFHRPHQHTIAKDEVARVRHFLTECGITPDQAA